MDPDFTKAPQPVSTGPVLTGQDSILKTPRFWTVQIICWSLLALFGFVVRLAIYADVPLSVTLTVCLDFSGLLLTSLFAWALGRHANPAESLKNVRTMLTGLVFCAFAAALQSGLALLLLSWSDMVPGSAIWPGSQIMPLITFVYFLPIFIGWTLAYFWIRSELAARQAQTEALRAQLQNLRLQLEPHFLFNALNTVITEIADRPEIAQEMIRKIAAYLRYSLRTTNQSVALVDEIQAVTDYLRICQLRFEDRLEVDIKVSGTPDAWLVPHMLVQSLVENSIKHGLSATDQTATIHIAIDCDADKLKIMVSNPGALHIDQHSHGIGLQNSRSRLALNYPARHRFSLDQDSDGVHAHIELWGQPCYA